MGRDEEEDGIKTGYVTVLSRTWVTVPVRGRRGELFLKKIKIKIRKSLCANQPISIDVSQRIRNGSFTRPSYVLEYFSRGL